MHNPSMSGLAETYYLNNIENIGIYFTKYSNFIKNIYACKVLKLCIQYIHLNC